MIYKHDENFLILNENMLFTEFNNHIILSEAWLLFHRGLPPSKTFAPLLLKFGLKTKEVCITIDFAACKEFLEENQKLNPSATDTLL